MINTNIIYNYDTGLCEIIHEESLELIESYKHEEELMSLHGYVKDGNGYSKQFDGIDEINNELNF